MDAVEDPQQQKGLLDGFFLLFCLMTSVSVVNKPGRFHLGQGDEEQNGPGPWKKGSRHVIPHFKSTEEQK